jgi:hypothetical protein
MLLMLTAVLMADRIVGNGLVHVARPSKLTNSISVTKSLQTLSIVCGTIFWSGAVHY